jgi:acyl-homoserine-lactone acylase
MTYRLLLAICSLCFLINSNSFAQSKINPDSVLIVRDSFGTPHIFARTDAEVAYGLAWANAEDAFETMQEALLTAQGNMGRLRGKSGAPFDFFVHCIGADMIYEQQKDQLSEDYLKYVDGYCQGVNAFAKANPDRVLLKKAFPVKPKDVIKAYIISFAALSGTIGHVEGIVEGKKDKQKPPMPVGSNAYAFSSEKTKDGKTYLCINPHFMIDGPLSFYDAHLNSQEGLNIVGTLFQGGTSVFMGNNEHLGWGHTYNYVDQVDVYELKMHKRKRLKYEFDGEYLKLEKRPIWLKVKIGKIVIPVRRMTYWSKYGPTLKSPDGRFFALRSPSYWAVQAGEQFYRMNKAKNLSEFKAALSMNALPMFNVLYADKEDNIYYICNSMLPKRSDKFDFSQMLLGNSSENLWTEYYSIEEKPHVENPDCGYVFNMNNTPSNATCPSSNFPKEKVDKYTDLRPGDNNRSTRFMEIVEGVDKMSWDDFVDLKFDRQLSKSSALFNSMQNLYQIDPTNYPHLSEPIRLMQGWDGNADLDNSEASFVLIALKHIFDKKGYGDNVFVKGVDISEAEYIEGIEYAARYMNKHHNSLRVPLRKICCHERNGKMYCAAGFPDMMSPGYSKPDSKGNMVMEYGDTYIHFVRFSKTGPELIKSLLPFENTKYCEDYKDELEMFNNQQMKTMSMDKAEVMKNAQKTYHPKGNTAGKN